MDLALILLLLALVSALFSLGFGIRIANELRARGLDANPLFIKWMVFSYTARYKRLMIEETGDPGPIYRGCTTAGTIALVLGLAGIIVKAVS